MLASVSARQSSSIGPMLPAPSFTSSRSTTRTPSPRRRSTKRSRPRRCRPARFPPRGCGGECALSMRPVCRAPGHLGADSKSGSARRRTVRDGRRRSITCSARAIQVSRDRCLFACRRRHRRRGATLRRKRGASKQIAIRPELAATCGRTVTQGRLGVHPQCA